MTDRARAIPAVAVLAAGLLLLLVLRPPPTGGPGTGAGPLWFRDAAPEAGLTATPTCGETTNKLYLPETAGTGVALLDHDGDGRLDIYLCDGATYATTAAGGGNTGRLYRNEGGLRFREVTAEAGLVSRGWGAGATAADYDNDGDPDLYLTRLGANVLYRNDGGRFVDVTAEAGVGDPAWSTGAAWLDADRDGDLDLYVANYVVFDVRDPGRHPRRCPWQGIPTMCGPVKYPRDHDVYYRNEGDGCFSRWERPAGLVHGVALPGFGVVASDLDEDGAVDLYIANDAFRNLLWRNRGDGTFDEIGIAAGVAMDAMGTWQSGMGVAAGDADGDGRIDLFVTNFDGEYYTLYRNLGGGHFEDVSIVTGIAATTEPLLGWGALLVDLDNDGDLDLYTANGHVYPEVEALPGHTYRQRDTLLRNLGDGRFEDATAAAGPGLLPVRGGRSAAFGDLDDDGDLDIVVTNLDEPPALLVNEGAPRGHFLSLRLVGTASNRDGYGARVTAEVGGRRLVREATPGGSYLASHDPRVHFGLGDATRVTRLEVAWPSGRIDVLTDVEGDRFLTMVEGEGLRSRATAPPRSGRPPRPPGSR